MNETIQANENQAPQLLEGVSELRKCNFAPQDHFIKIRFKNSDDESFYLEVKWREFWFHTFCTENGIFGSIIENDAALIAGTQFLQASAETTWSMPCRWPRLLQRAVPLQMPASERCSRRHLPVKTVDLRFRVTAE